MEARTITAIEIGSSKVKGAVAGVEPDGRVKVLAIAEVRADNAVRYGRIQNVREVSTAVNNVLHRLESAPAVAPRKVAAVTLSLGGRSLTGATASATLTLSKEKDIEITDQAIKRLRNEAQKDMDSSKNVVASIARSYFANGQAISGNPVGSFANTLRGDFIMVLCAPENRQNLERLKFDSVNSADVDIRILPLAQADMVLTPDDRQLGCALIDFGAETTTVSVYKNGSLCFIAALPMGSRLITKDLMNGLTLTEASAEDYKIRLANMGDSQSTDSNAEEVNNYARARAGEIVANIINQIKLSGVSIDNLGAGIVLVGGGAKLTGFDSMLASQTHLNVRKASLPDFVSFAEPEDEYDNISIVSLLLAADPKKQGLTAEIVEEQTPQTDEIAETPQDDDPIVFSIDSTVEEEPVKKTEPEPEARRRRKQRTLDDDDLLADDPDDETTPKTKSPSNTASTEINDRLDDVNDDDNDTDDDNDRENDTPAGGRLHNVTKRLKDLATKIFAPYDDEDDDDEEEDV